MTTSFIKQPIDVGIHALMYQVSQQLDDIVNPLHNEVQQARELELKQSNSGDNFVTSTVQEIKGNQGQEGYQSRLIVATT